MRRVIFAIAALLVAPIPTAEPAPAAVVGWTDTVEGVGNMRITPGLCYPLAFCSPNTATFSATTDLACFGSSRGAFHYLGRCSIKMDGTLSSNLLFGPYCGWHYAEGRMSIQVTDHVTGLIGEHFGIPFTWRFSFGSAAITFGDGYQGAGSIKILVPSAGESCFSGADDWQFSTKVSVSSLT